MGQAVSLDLCAYGCGSNAARGIYCASCSSARFDRVATVGPTADDELDVAFVVRGRRPKTHACMFDDCRQPAMLGRLYCSKRCRSRARHEGPATIVIDGIEATLQDHAARCGIDVGTVYFRMKRGISPVEAVTRPLAHVVILDKSIR